ncbi:MAG: UDP-N-acetylmuramoyl-tripeptide--D-alanyl-D-alanine ligase [Polyangiaceae bacterium]
MATPIGANRAMVDARSVAEATGGRVVRSTAGRAARGVTTDSRAVVPGGAFVALRGEKHDAHAFVAAAIEAGAALVVVERGRSPDDPRADAVEVDDTLVAWGAIAKAHLRVWRRANPAARVVAITGSAGKTTTKELCAALLRPAGSGGTPVGDCHATAGNLNNRVGVPAVVLELEPRHRFAVLEVGMSLPGEIAALAAIVEPDVAVITNVGLAHAGGVGGSLDDVAREKGALFEGVRPGGVCVANADDPAVLAQLARAPRSARVTSFGRAEAAQYRLVAREPLGAEGSRVSIERRGVDRVTVVLPIPGEAAAVDLAAALAAADAAAEGPVDPIRAMGSLAPIAGRMQVRRAAGVTVLDDAYNANPGSMRAALATLAECGDGRRVAVLGEMKELGPAAEREHAALADAVAAAGVALLVSCGGLADVLARAAQSRGVEVVLAPSADAASRATVERVRPGDVVLVKASRSVGAERVVEALLARDGH